MLSKAMNIKIFADGADSSDILKLNKNKIIKGFTTNPTLMKKAGIKDYKEFAFKILSKIKNKPISFEVFEDDIDKMYNQAIEINSWGKNVNVKIPITNTKSISCSELIQTLCHEGVHCNVTAIFLPNQIELVLNKLKKDSKIILSIFAGRIADTGIDPVPIIKEALALSKGHTSSEILWASPREALNIIQADQLGCHIITLTPDLINKINNFGKNLEEFSLETVKMFYNDAKTSKYKF
jgi:transaldolase|tara:strand:+ start:1241 stop:1954 length:714 start_codon:yes stop_codon:yes gene_type:complete